MITLEAIRTRLSRISSSGRIIPEIEGLRFLAIFGVLAYHVAGPMAAHFDGRALERDPLYVIAAQGFFGVQLFFVISGFILSLPFADSRLHGRPRPSLRRYLWRRVTRLEPPYIVNLLVLAIALLVTSHHAPGVIAQHLGASLVYSGNWLYPSVGLINGVTWSLEIEIQFYLLAPLLCMVFAIRDTRLRRAVLLGAIVCAAVANELLRAQMPVPLRLSLVHQIEYFLTGLLLADVFLVSWKGQAPTRSYVWDGIGAVAWIAAGVTLMKINAPRCILPPLLFVMYVGAFRGQLTNRFLRLPWLVTIGGMCYTIYLYHQKIVHLALPLTAPCIVTGWPFWANFPLQLLLLGAIVLVVCGVLFALLERPFMGRRWTMPRLAPWRATAPHAEAGVPRP